MISLTGLKGQKQNFKMSSIKEIKSVPDTVLIMTDGNCVMVRETAEEVVGMIIDKPVSKAARLLGAFI